MNYGAALALDSLRVASIHTKVAGAPAGKNSVILGSQISVPAKSGLVIGSGNYVITVGFGTPSKSQTVIFDTGSDVSWIQCKPCVGTCYSQREPIFDPKLSSTYRNFTCTSPTCLGLPSSGCYKGNTCLYGVSYGDSSTTVGFLASDTFKLTPQNLYNDFIFGCGQQNQGLFQGAAGLMGLGRSAYSLNKQLASSLGNVFSYCLPSTSSTTGFLNLGNPLKVPTGYTSIVTDSRAPSLYFVSLIGIKVGGIQLQIAPSVFSVGTIIDSGTVITRLQTAAYSALREAFRAGMTRYTLAQPFSILDTCYDFSQLATVTVPVITLQYAGLDVQVPAAGYFYTISPSQVCLAFAGNSDASQIGIIGNVQQKTMEVIYNNVLGKIGFSATACS